MKKYLFSLLLMIVTFAVFSVPIDRPPDNGVVKIEITKQQNFIFPVVINEPILTVTETIYQTKETPTITAIYEKEREAQKGKAINTHLKKSGTERYLTLNFNYNKLKATDNKELVLPRIR